MFPRLAYGYSYMTKDKQRITIAKTCGWRFSPYAAPEMEEVAILSWIRPNGADWQPECLPDYLNDLNAMHEAEKEIIARNKMNGFDGYENTLCGIIDNGNCVNATASQKAEAFLRTLDLWN